MTVIGVGLLGASILKANRRARIAKKAFGIHRNRSSYLRTRRHGISYKAVIGLDKRVLKRSDLVILATPVQSISRIMKHIQASLSPGCVVIDVGSTKRAIMKTSKIISQNIHFVGCHPVAGSEKKGAAYADPDLFRGASNFVIKGAAPAIQDRVVQLWSRLGARSYLVSDKSHDALLARISHLPHLVAALLMLSAGRKRSDLKYAAGGLKDTTRIACADPVMWRDIILTNRDPIVKELRYFTGNIHAIIRLIRQSNGPALVRLLRRAKSARNQMIHDSNAKLNGSLD